MKLHTTLGVVAALAMAFPVMATAQATDTQKRISAPQYGISADLQMRLEDSYIFVFKDSVRADRVAGQARALMRINNGQVRHVFNKSMRGFSAKVPAAVAARLAQNNPDIAYYEKDQPVFAFQSQPAQQVPWGITRVNGGVDGTGLTAWVIDTGIQLDHPDLNVDTTRSTDFAADRCVFIWCFDDGDNGGVDGNGHGTHVAGTIGARDNGIGVVGVAANATLVAVRVLDNNGSGAMSDVIAGVDYVGANAAPGDVANMSLGGGFSQALNDAVIRAANKGVLFALAAGNEAQHAGNVSPGSVEHPNVFTVSAIDDMDRFASFSNFGNPPVDCAAPGVGVLSTFLNSGYATLSGTSMASPHVAGLLLLNGTMLATDGSAINDPDGIADAICVN